MCVRASCPAYSRPAHARPRPAVDTEDGNKQAKLTNQRERQAAALQLARQATGLLERTRLNVRVVCQAIHAKVPRHMLVDMIDYLEPTLVLVGSRGLTKLKGCVVLSTFAPGARAADIGESLPQHAPRIDVQLSHPEVERARHGACPCYSRVLTAAQMSACGLSRGCTVAKPRHEALTCSTPPRSPSLRRTFLLRTPAPQVTRRPLRVSRTVTRKLATLDRTARVRSLADAAIEKESHAQAVDQPEESAEGDDVKERVDELDLPPESLSRATSRETSG